MGMLGYGLLCFLLVFLLANLLKKGTREMKLEDLIEELDQRYGNPYMAKEYGLIQEAIAVLREMAKAQEK
jgi:hypothetical protein